VRFLWYWPFARPEELEWARCVAGGEHEVVVEVIDRDAAPAAGRDSRVEIRRDLPDVTPGKSGPMWAWSRARTYLGRERIRTATTRNESFDVVHYHYPNRFTDSWRRPRGGLWVVSVHDVLPHSPRLGPLERWLLGRLYRRPDGLIVHHHWLEQLLVDEFRVEPERVRVVPHQVFPVDEPVERTAGDEPPMVLFFGALRENKGLDTLIEAIRLVPAGSLRLHIAGRGDARCEALARRAADDSPFVTAEIGHATTERKAELFRASAVVALPYTSFSSQSGVLHDAYGHWRPVVVTDVGALGPTVRADGTGVVIDSDAQALAEALMTVIGPDGDAYGVNARRVSEERSPRAVALQTLDAYAHFLTRSAAGLAR
jgi:glycosyltransferase involved in cell wall biosynthesis